MTGLDIIAALLLAVAVSYLIVVLARRYNMQPSEPGSWTAPLSLRKWAGREPGFDRTVHRIEQAKTTRREWQALLSHLDTIADELDPRPESGLRRVVPFRRGIRFWIPVTEAGEPRHYDRQYLADRLSAIEQHTRGANHGR